jgi:excisionase family DNA binding protein
MLGLLEAASELGVHYQTAYRWVRTGRLAAQFVNGRYEVARSDLQAFEARRHTPSPPRGPGTNRLDRQTDRMQMALLAGDEAVARQVIRRLVDEGTSLTDVIQAVLVPPLRRIGEAWHDGDVPIWVEHRAAAIVERILGEIAPNPRGRRRGTVMVTAVAGDQHALPTTMATVALREHNWHVHHLGANMPATEVVRYCAEHSIDVAVISLTNPDATNVATRLAHRLRAAGVPTVLGGPGRSLTELLVEVSDATHRRDR